MRDNIETLDLIFETIDNFESWLNVSQNIEVKSSMEKDWSLCLQTLLILFKKVTYKIRLKIENNVVDFNLKNPFIKDLDLNDVEITPASGKNELTKVILYIENEVLQEYYNFKIQLQFNFNETGEKRRIRLRDYNVFKPHEVEI